MRTINKVKWLTRDILTLDDDMIRAILSIRWEIEAYEENISRIMFFEQGITFPYLAEILREGFSQSDREITDEKIVEIITNLEKLEMITCYESINYNPQGKDKETYETMQGLGLSISEDNDKPIARFSKEAWIF